MGKVGMGEREGGKKKSGRGREREESYIEKQI